MTPCNIGCTTAVSLRGSLADNLHKMIVSADRLGCQQFLEELLLTDNPAVEKRVCNGVLVIGMHDETGSSRPIGNYPL